MALNRRIEIGERFFGDVIDVRRGQAPKTGFIEKHEDGSIYLTILDTAESYYEATGVEVHPGIWFQQGLRPSDDGFFLFKASELSIALYGCSEVRRSHSTSRVTSTVIYRAEHVVHTLGSIPLEGGAGTMKAEVSGLINWLGCSPLMVGVPVGPETGGAFSAKTVDIAPFPIDQNETFSRDLRADYALRDEGWGHFRGPSRTFLSVGVVQREASQGQNWRESFRDAAMVRDLLSISCWSPQEVLDISVTFELLAPDQEEERRIWHLVDGVDHLADSMQSNKSNQHLYLYSDLQGGGIRRWFDLHTESAAGRAIQALDVLLRTRLPLTNRIQLLGSALDGIAHSMYPREETEENYVGFRTDCERLRKAIRPIVGRKEFPDWPKRMADAYNASKHAGKAYVGDQTLVFRTYSEGLFIARLLLGKLLGISDDSLKSRIKQDPLNPRNFQISESRDVSERWGAQD